MFRSCEVCNLGILPLPKLAHRLELVLEVSEICGALTLRPSKLRLQRLDLRTVKSTSALVQGCQMNPIGPLELVAPIPLDSPRPVDGHRGTN